MRVAWLLSLLLGSGAALHTLRAAVRAHARSHVRMLGDDSWDGRFMDELNSRISDSQNSAARMGAPEAVLEQLPSVYVLIFNVGRHNEGVYTLQGTVDSIDAYVLAFEQTDEAQRFAELLEAEGFDLPQPLEWPADQVSQFCHMNEFQLGIVPTGTLLTPPEKNCYDVEAFEELDGLDAEGAGAGADRSAALDETRQFLDRLFLEGPGDERA